MLKVQPLALHATTLLQNFDEANESHGRATMTPLTTGSTVQRTYLFAPPEEKVEAQALGACWDADSKRWYIDLGEPSTKD